MKKVMIVFMALTMLLPLAGCGGSSTASGSSAAGSSTAQPSSETSEAPVSKSSSDTGPEEQSSSSSQGTSDADAEGETSQQTPSSSQPQDSATNILVAYFSATGNTEGIAAELQNLLQADLYQIIPQVPYTQEDLNYSEDECRANQEQNDPSARPAISESLENMDDYDVIFLGYPIWWGQAPKIISTFLESYDFSGKVIVPFCTSGSSGIGSSASNLHDLASDAQWMDGQRFSGSASGDEIQQWVNGLELEYEGFPAGL